MPNAASFYETKTGLGPTENLFSPVWTLRLFPLLALAALALALFVFRAGMAHTSCVLFAALILGPVVRLAFQITNFNLRRPYERSDVDQLPLA